jgi:hypothetical protein
MIRYIYEAKVAAGKMIQVAQYAVEQVEFVKKYNDIPPVTAFTTIFGDAAVLTFACDYRDMDQYAKVYNQAVADPEYMQRAVDHAHLFIEGSTKIKLMRSL